MLARTGVPVEVPAAPRERPDGRRQRGGEPPAVHADPHLLDGSCPGPGPAGESYTTAVHVSSAAEEVGNTRRDHEGTDPDTRYPARQDGRRPWRHQALTIMWAAQRHRWYPGRSRVAPCQTQFSPSAALSASTSMRTCQSGSSLRYSSRVVRRHNPRGLASSFHRL